MLLEIIEKLRRKAEITIMELCRISRAVYSCQIEYEITVYAVSIQLLCGIFDIVLVDIVNSYVRSCPILAVPNVFQIMHKSGSYHALCTCHEDIHILITHLTYILFHLLSKPIYHYVYERRNTAYLASEEMRLLYVAMTRAKDRLFITFKNDKKFRSALSKATVSLNTNGGINENLTARAECMADWILPVLMLHPEGSTLRELSNGFMCKTFKSAPKVKFTEWEEDTVSVQKKQKAVADDRKLSELRKSIEYDYDLSLSETAAKLTVTEIAAESREMTLKRPKFVTSEGKLSGAEKGTATHLFMQYCDMSLAEKDVSSERDRLYENGLLGNKESTAIEIPLIEKFFRSELYSRMKSAEKIERERKFLLRISDIDVPDELKKAYENTDGMIQGVIDCLFEEDDGIVLVDYKTDSSKDEAALRAEYAPQLILYKAALEAVYGEKVKEAVIYSFRLGREIRISA